MHWRTPTSERMTEARMSKSQMKVVTIVFFYIGGVIMIYGYIRIEVLIKSSILGT
jgi:amino acid permease